MAKTKSLTQYEVDTFKESDVGIFFDGHWDNSPLDYGLKLEAKDRLAVVGKLIAWVDADLQPHMSQFAVTDKDPQRLSGVFANRASFDRDGNGAR